MTAGRKQTSSTDRRKSRTPFVGVGSFSALGGISCWSPAKCFLRARRVVRSSMSAQAPVGALARSHPITQHSLHEKACPESKGSPLGSLPMIRALGRPLMPSVACDGSVNMLTENIVFETTRWLKRQNGKRETDKKTGVMPKR